jgi:hypothetical protein
MNVLVALVMSLVAPGSGQAYNGEMPKAYAFAGISVLVPTLFLPLVVRAMSHGGGEWGMAMMGFAYPVVVLMAVLDAVGQAVRIHRGTLKTEGGGWKIGLIFLVAIVVANVAIKLSGISLKLMAM